MRTPAERQNPIVARAIAARRAEGKIPARFVQSLKDHARNEELIAKKKKPEKLRSTFDFDIWGEKGIFQLYSFDLSSHFTFSIIQEMRW